MCLQCVGKKDINHDDDGAICDAFVPPHAPFLRQTENATLEELKLSGNYCGPLGAAALGAAIRANLALKVRGPGLLGRFPAHACAVMNSKHRTFWSRLSHLRSLLSGAGYCHRSCHLHLPEPLSSPPLRPQEVVVAGNAIGNEGVRAMVEGLRVTEAPITTVDFSSNDIGLTGAEAIGEWLAEDKKCTDLNLYANDMGDKGALPIAAAVKVNKTLETLDIGGNNIRAAGMKELAAALKENSTLTTLELPYNPFGPEGAKARRKPHAVCCVIVSRHCLT